MLCTFYGGYCSLWPNRTARSLSRAWPSLLRARNHIGGATAVPLHHKKCLLCSVLIYIVLDLVPRPRSTASDGRRRHGSPRLAECWSLFRVSLERDTHTGGEALTGRNRHRREHGCVKSIADTADNLAFVAISRQGPSLTPARCRCRASSAMGHLRE